ncbi:hypothetical protein DVH05_016055 [Phytophthora capsici]|nr:hypothetical protein DVH05_016055 [Phytophthora capsici]|eukprot:jgi/Phyca11/117742/e_gw1.34.296.1
MTKQRRSLAYSAEYEFGDDNILTATFLEETRLRNRQRVKQARSVLDAKADCRTVNNAKKVQQEQDRNVEIIQHNQILLEHLESIHKKLPKQYDVSHHSQEYLRPTNFLLWQQEQDRIEEENKRMQRRINQTKSHFDTNQLAVDAAKNRYLSDQLSKADRRKYVKHKCKELQSNSRQRHTDCSNFSLSKIESKYSTSTGNFPTVTNTTKLIRASDFLPRLGR